MIKKIKRIQWICGHVWYAWNTTMNPNRDKEAIKFGCPYCREKRVDKIKDDVGIHG